MANLVSICRSLGLLDFADLNSSVFQIDRFGVPLGSVATRQTNAGNFSARG